MHHITQTLPDPTRDKRVRKNRGILTPPDKHDLQVVQITQIRDLSDLYAPNLSHDRRVCSHLT